MTYRRVAVFDNIGSNLGPHLIPCISFIEQSRHHGSILVHCRQGVSRSSTICVAYLMKMRGMRFPEALAYVKAQRSAARPNAAFVSQLEDYDAQLEEAREKAAARGDGRRGGGAGGALAGGKRPFDAPSNGGAGGGGGGGGGDKKARTAMRGPSLGPSAAVGPAAAVGRVAGVAGAGAVGAAAVGAIGPSIGPSAGPPAAGGEGGGSGNGGGAGAPEAEDAECEECGEEPSTLLCTECGVRYCDECEAATHDHLRAKRGEDHGKFVKRDVKGDAKGDAKGGAVT